MNGYSVRFHYHFSYSWCAYMNIYIYIYYIDTHAWYRFWHSLELITYDTEYGIIVIIITHSIWFILSLFREFTSTECICELQKKNTKMKERESMGVRWVDISLSLTIIAPIAHTIIICAKYIHSWTTDSYFKERFEWMI